MRMCCFPKDIISFQGVNVEQIYEGGLCPLKIYVFFSFTGLLYLKLIIQKVKKDIFWCKIEFWIDLDHLQVSRISHFWEKARKLTLGHGKGICTFKICIFWSFTGFLQSKLTLPKLKKDITWCKINFVIDLDHA